jgi:uncharacterized protein YbaR (Trm112 family)
MDKRLLDIICCPVTRLPLEVLDAERLSRLNAAIAAGTIKNHGEQSVSASVVEALVTRDGRLAYPVRDGIPILLEDECIDLKQLPA